MRLFDKRLAVPLVVVVVGVLSISTPVFAQARHVVDPGAVAAAVDAHVAKQDADRTAIRTALARPQVREMAARMGMDLDRVNASLSTLDDHDLSRVADAARHVNQSFVGGASTVVISTTTIIIALLVLILIVVAVR